MANANSVLSIGTPSASAPQMASGQTVGPTTVYNPNVPGNPYFGANAQQANQIAQQKAGVSPPPAPAGSFNQFGGSNTGGTSFSGNSNGGQQITPYAQIGSTLQGINQQAQQQAQQAEQQSQQQATQKQQALTQATNLLPGQGPENQLQALSAIAPQSLLPQGQTPQTQIAQQNQQQVQQPQYQQPQVGGFPIQQTSPQLPPTGNLSTPQTVTDPSQQPAPQIDPNSQIQAYNNSTGQTETVSPDDPRFGSGQLMQNPVGYQTGQTTPQQNIIQAIGSNSQQDFSSMLSNAMQAGPNTSGAALLKLSLQQQLGAIDDPNINTYLNNQIARTQQAYEMGMGYNSAQSSELQEAIAGTLTDPQTLVGEQAKAAQEAKDQNLQTISAQSAWNQAQQAATTDQLQTKQSSLEGFLKAQLALNAGSDTGPSTAALTVMSQSLHEGQINMTLQNAGYTFGQNQLAIQGSKVMTDYTNQVMTLGAQVNQQRMQTTSDYYSGLNSIDSNALSNEQQKRQLTSAAYGDYAQKMTDLNNNEQNRQVQYAQLAHTTLQDNITDANQISGTTGMVYQPDGEGGFQQALDQNGNPIQTLTAKQNQFTDSNMSAQLGLQSWSDNAAVIKGIADQAISAGALPGTPAFAQYGNAMEQLTGSPPGSMNSITGGANGLNQYIDAHVSGASQALTQVADGTASQIPQGIQKIFGVGTNGGQCGVYAGTLSTAPNVGNTWNQKIATVQAHGSIQDNPQPGYKMVIPLGVNTDGKEPGHVETVISVDPKTGNMLMAQSNMDLKGTVSMTVQNLSDIKQKYGQNWGFIPGQLQPGIQTQLSAYTAQNGSQVTMQPQGKPNWDALGASIGNGVSQNNALYASKLASGDMTLDQVRSAVATSNPTATTAIVNQIVSAAASQNPNFSDGQVAAKTTFLNGWTGAAGAGSMGYTNQTAQTALGHLEILNNAFKSLENNSSFVGKDWNGVIQFAAQHGDDPALAAFNAAIDPVTGELGKAMTGGVPGETEMADLAKQFNSATGPQSMQAIVKTYAQLEGEKLNTNINAYKENIGHLPSDSLITPSGGAFMQSLGLDPKEYDPTYGQTQNSNQMNIPTIGTTASTALSSFNLSGNQEPSPMGSSIQKAKQLGYNSQDIITHLQSNPAYASKISAAQAAGYTADEIAQYYNQ